MYSIADEIPTIWALANGIASELRSGLYSEWEPLMERLTPLVDPNCIDEIDQTVPGWRKIATLHNGVTAKHTLLVLASCLNLTEYEESSPQTQRELEWAAVLHDLDKDRLRSDTAHPFRSAAVAVKTMPQLGFKTLPGVGAADLNAWSELVMSAQREDGERMVHDHTFLPQIMDGLRNCWGEGTPEARILKAILFHQSLPALKDWPNAVLMTDQEISFSLTLDDMNVLGPLMIADSDSWNIFDEPRLPYLAELRTSNEETRQRIQQNLKQY